MTETETGRLLSKRHAYCDPMHDIDSLVGAVETEAAITEADRLAEQLENADAKLAEREDEIARLRGVIDFRPATLSDGRHGPDLLDLLADWFDVVDDARGKPNRVAVRAVQADLRKWAADMRAALAPEADR